MHYYLKPNRRFFKGELLYSVFRRSHGSKHVMLVTPTKNCNQKWTILFILCLREYACGWKKVVKFKAIRIKHS